MSRTRGGRTLFNPALAATLIGFAVWCGFAGFNARGATSPQAALWLFFSAVAAFEWIIATARVTTSPSSLIVVNFGRAHRIARQDVLAIEADAGLVVRLQDGRSVRSAAFARSLGGELLHYRRAHRAMKQLDAWLDEQQPANSFTSATATRPRPALWWAPIACMAIFALIIYV